MKINATTLSPIGMLSIYTDNDQLFSIQFTENHTPPIKPKTLVAKETVLQLQCYFADPRFKFDIPYCLQVSEFEQRVLNALRQIPCGKTQTYGELATQLNSGARAIGNACRINPIPILIPCHRVLAKSSIGGFAGQTSGHKIDIKHWLLQHEKS